MRALLVENPHAGGGRVGRDELDLPAGVVRRRPRRPRALVRQSAHRYDRIIVRGGDGTVSAAARGLLESGSDASLALVPGGTGNDFASALELPEEPREALQLALTGRPRAIDLGAVNGRPFINAVTVGPAAELSHGTSRRSKALLGRFAYLFEALRHPTSLEPFEARVKAGARSIEGTFLFLGVANGRSVGGGTEIAPRSIVTDGHLDLVLLPAGPLRQVAGAWRALRRGEDHPHLVRLRARFIDVTLLSPGVSVSRDGERLRGRRLRFEVLRRAIRLVVPRAARV